MAAAKKTSKKKAAGRTSRKAPAKKKATRKRPASKSPSKKRPSSKKASKKQATGKRATGTSTASGDTPQLPFEGPDTIADLLYPPETIADLLGITDRRLRQLAVEGIVPKATRGHYPLAGCVRGYVSYLQRLREGGDTKHKESTRLTKARADEKELELQLKRNELYRRDVVDHALFNAATTLTAMLDGVAGRVASQLGGGAALRGRLQNEFRDIRRQFAASLREFSGRLREDGWDRGPATGSRARRVGKKKPRVAKGKR